MGVCACACVCVCACVRACVRVCVCDPVDSTVGLVIFTRGDFHIFMTRELFMKIFISLAVQLVDTLFPDSHTCMDYKSKTTSITETRIWAQTVKIRTSENYRPYNGATIAPLD